MQVLVLPNEESPFESVSSVITLEKKFIFWVKSNYWTMSLLALLSFSSATIMGALLVMAQELVSITTDDSRSRLIFLSFEQLGGSKLKVYVGVLILWTILTSLTQLAHAKVLKSHILKNNYDEETLKTSYPDADENSNFTQNRKVSSERQLLSGVLGLITTTTRLIGLSVVLALSYFGPLVLGLIFFWFLVLSYGVFRFRKALRFGVAFSALSQTHRTDLVEINEFVEMLYERDRNVYRISLGQSIILSVTLVTLIVAPLWRFSETLPIAGSMIVIMLLPSLNAFLTETSSLGYRVTLAFLPRKLVERKRNLTEQVLDSSGVIETRSPILNWNRRYPLWVRQFNPVGTIILVADGKCKVGDSEALRLARMSAKAKFETLIIDAAIAEGKSLLPFELNKFERLANYAETLPIVILVGGERLEEGLQLSSAIVGSRVVLLDAEEEYRPSNETSVRRLSSNDFINLLKSSAIKELESESLLEWLER